MAIDKATAQARIDEIDAVLNSGVQSATSDGSTVTYDHASLRRQRAHLQRIVNGTSSGVRVGRYNRDWNR